MGKDLREDIISNEIRYEPIELLAKYDGTYFLGFYLKLPNQEVKEGNRVMTISGLQAHKRSEKLPQLTRIADSLEKLSGCIDRETEDRIIVSTINID